MSSALVNYNVLLLLGMFLSALAAWALAREMTGDPITSTLAGLVFAFLPWRFSQLPHLQFQWAVFLCLSACSSSCGISSEARGGTLVLYGICFGWNALCNVHYALFSGFLVGLTLAFFALGVAGDARRRWKRAVLATVLGGLVFVPFALPYREASRLYGMRRYLGEVRHFSGQAERLPVHGHAEPVLGRGDGAGGPGPRATSSRGSFPSRSRPLRSRS